jgi:hypothetical protein
MPVRPALANQEPSSASLPRGKSKRYKKSRPDRFLRHADRLSPPTIVSLERSLANRTLSLAHCAIVHQPVSDQCPCLTIESYTTSTLAWPHPTTTSPHLPYSDSNLLLTSLVSNQRLRPARRLTEPYAQLPTTPKSQPR